MNDMCSQRRQPQSTGMVRPGMTDGQLLEVFNSGCDETADTAFSALVHRHGPMVWRLCVQLLGDRHSAEDAFQATFLVLARRSRAIRQPDLLGNWLYGVALRTAREARVRTARHCQYLTTLTPSVADAGTADETEPEKALIRSEVAEAVHEEVERLPERYRLPVVLCELQGLTYQEAARLMRCPVATVGVRLSRARKRLRVRLVRRGIVPAAAALHALLGAEGASVWVPVLLVRATGRNALSHAVGGELSAGASLEIAQMVSRALGAARLKAASCAALTIGLALLLGQYALLHRNRDRADSVVNGSRTEASVPPTSGVPQARAVSVTPVARAGAVVASEVPTDVDERTDKVAAAPDDHAPALLKPERPRHPAQAEIARGRLLFTREWAVNDPMSRGGDGLGPVYNETSCVACHGLGGPGGGGSNSKNVVIMTAVANGVRGLPTGLERLHPGFRDSRSTVLHRFGTDPAYGPWRIRFLEMRRNQAQAEEDDDEAIEVRIRQAAEQAALNRRRRVGLTSVNPIPGVTLSLTERNTPALFGAGLIDAIPADVIEEQVAQQPLRVRGRAGRDQNGVVGRFGWKAQVASLHAFVRGACAGELGLEVAGHSQSPSPLSPSAAAKGIDMSESDCDALVAYVRALPAPVAADPAGEYGTPRLTGGRQLFAAVGCTSCHAPSLGEVRGIYSDLLLHDMGPGLIDSGIYYGFRGPASPGGPSPGEWRTPPLWGFRDSGPYLHDGRAETLVEAVALHGGQSAAAAKAFFELSAEQQSQVEAFLKSLVAPSAATGPGILLAGELEERVEPETIRRLEAQVRKQREAAAERERVRRLEGQRRRLAVDAAQRARVQFPLAQSLERMGKTNGAMQFYRQIARDAPETAEGRKAADRIAKLANRQEVAP